MNNDAFKELVRSKVKSTKEIAREVVEEAFAKKHKKHKKRKRRGGVRDDDDDLDSSDSEGESRGKNKLKKKHDDDDLDDDGPSSVKRSSKDENVKKKESSRYRDRAQERREGKNADYEDSQKLLEAVSKNQEGEESALAVSDLSKFLGGDEAHTHLVKGLDVALALSVRQRLQPTNSRTKVEGGKDAEERKPELESLKPIATKEEALKFFQTPQLDSAFSNSALGRSVFQYFHRRLKSKADSIEVSSAGAGLQRTQLLFAVDWYPQDLARAWEVPIEKSLATTIVEQQHSALTKASPITRDLIQSIKRHHAAASHATKSPSMPTTKEEDTSDDDIFPEDGD